MLAIQYTKAKKKILYNLEKFEKLQDTRQSHRGYLGMFMEPRRLSGFHFLLIDSRMSEILAASVRSS